MEQQNHQQPIGGFVYVAHQGFRSLTDTKDEFSGLEEQFPTLELKRDLKPKKDKQTKMNDFCTGTDIEYLWKFVVASAKKTFTKVTLNDNAYKLTCEQ